MLQILTLLVACNDDLPQKTTVPNSENGQLNTATGKINLGVETLFDTERSFPINYTITPGQGKIDAQIDSKYMYATPVEVIGFFFNPNKGVAPVVERMEWYKDPERHALRSYNVVNNRVFAQVELLNIGPVSPDDEWYAIFVVGGNYDNNRSIDFGGYNPIPEETNKPHTYRYSDYRHFFSGLSARDVVELRGVDAPYVSSVVRLRYNQLTNSLTATDSWTFKPKFNILRYILQSNMVENYTLQELSMNSNNFAHAARITLPDGITTLDGFKNGLATLFSIGGRKHIFPTGFEEDPDKRPIASGQELMFHEIVMHNRMAFHQVGARIEYTDASRYIPGQRPISYAPSIYNKVPTKTIENGKMYTIKYQLLSDLLITEIVYDLDEQGNKKTVVEIYNPTLDDIDLSQYALVRMKPDANASAFYGYAPNKTESERPFGVTDIAGSQVLPLKVLYAPYSMEGSGFESLGFTIPPINNRNVVVVGESSTGLQRMLAPGKTILIADVGYMSDVSYPRGFGAEINKALGGNYCDGVVTCFTNILNADFQDGFALIKKVGNGYEVSDSSVGYDQTYTMTSNDSGKTTSYYHYLNADEGGKDRTSPFYRVRVPGNDFRSNVPTTYNIGKTWAAGLLNTSQQWGNIPHSLGSRWPLKSTDTNWRRPPAKRW